MTETNFKLKLKKYLIKQENYYYSIKDKYYDIESKKYLSCEKDFNNGFDTIDELLKKYNSIKR